LILGLLFFGLAVNGDSLKFAKRSHNQKGGLKGFGPIGMMELWNCGMMGLKKPVFKTHIISSIFLF